LHFVNFAKKTLRTLRLNYTQRNQPETKKTIKTKLKNV
jgi:hypothetical protein